MVIRTCAWAAAAPAEACHVAPASTRADAFSRVRLETWSEWPAFCRWPAMLRPITPVPMNAIESGADMVWESGENAKIAAMEARGAGPGDDIFARTAN